ncbi:hypothetical protein EHM82_05235 [bacterium]|nr:MAG: hypothetical protein EHM82_05235 [bacterium]
MSDPSGVPARLALIRSRMEAACRRAGREPGSVTLVGASKTQPLPVLAAGDPVPVARLRTG